jgi:uncharacterized protein (DUF1697 family)
MERYIAFLRGINVSGQKIIKMEVLRKVFSDAGFADVVSYIQSGNVLFNSDARDSEQLILQIEELIVNSFGFRTEVILRKLTDIEAIVNTPLFVQLKSDSGNKYYITFLKEEFTNGIEVPFLSKNKDVEIIFHENNNLISISHLYKGNYGFPNSFIEKLTGIPATTRNPNTLEKILTL